MLFLNVFFFTCDYKVEECHDRYIVTGDEYKELRDTIVTAVLSEKSERLELLLQVCRCYLRWALKFKNQEQINNHCYCPQNAIWCRKYRIT